VAARADLVRVRAATAHAGGKWTFQYQTATGGNDSLQVDLNFMLRVPLWPVVLLDSRPLGPFAARGVPVLDEHELAAGKLAALLAALLARRASRDLFDAHHG
jgi:hypothetical protein